MVPHLGQCLSVEREHRNTEHHFAITVREHSDTRADEDIDDRPILGHVVWQFINIELLKLKNTCFVCLQQDSNHPFI